MSPAIAPYLTVILFLPWFAILGALFWWLPRLPRTPARRRFDLAALALSTVAFVASVRWAFDAADPGYGAMWRQVLATAVGYGVFLAVLGAAAVARRHILAR